MRDPADPNRGDDAQVASNVRYGNEQAAKFGGGGIGFVWVCFFAWAGVVFFHKSL